MTRPVPPPRPDFPAPDMVDLSTAIDLLNNLVDLLDRIEEVPIPPRADRNKARHGPSAETGRRLLYASHQCDRIKVALLDEYYKIRNIT